LPAEPEQDAVDPLGRDHLLDEVRRQRQEVHVVGELVRGLDGRDVGIDENRVDALFLERLEGLRPGVVELASLTDFQCAGSQHEHALRRSILLSQCTCQR
jgi:hypothetical protein